MKIIVCGGRDYQDRERVFAELNEIHEDVHITLVIHGACGWTKGRPQYTQYLRGADRWAHEWALLHKVDVQPYAADWVAYGASAGPKRNQQMAKDHPTAHVLALPGGKGTKGMIQIARDAEMFVHVIK